MSHFGRKRTGAGLSAFGQRRSRDVEKLTALLVTEAAQWLEPIERALQLRHVHHAPGDDVATRCRPERGEVAAQDLGSRFDRDMPLRLLERDEPALRASVPERRLVMVHNVRAYARGLPGAASVDPGEPVLSLEMCERFLRFHWTRRDERAHRRREALRQR